VARSHLITVRLTAQTSNTPSISVPFVPPAKYKTAGEITSKAIKAVIQAAKEGATVGELCKVGDDAVKEGTGSVYKSDKKMAKGE
jgi:hypothetical protein